MEKRYRPLPTGHGLDRAAVARDQRRRLQQAMIELIAEKGYPAVRIADLAKLARVSQPTLYSLYADFDIGVDHPPAAAVRVTGPDRDGRFRVSGAGAERTVILDVRAPGLAQGAWPMRGARPTNSGETP